MRDTDHAAAAWDALSRTQFTYDDWWKNVMAGRYPARGGPSQWGIANDHLLLISPANANHVDTAWKALTQTTKTFREWQRKVLRGVYPDVGPPSMWGIARQAIIAIVDAPPVPTGAVAAPGSTGNQIDYLPYSAIPLNVQTSGSTLEDIAIDDGSGDSAILVGSGGHFAYAVTLRRIRVRGAARGNAVSWGKHGAYLDCYNSVLEDMDVECSAYASNGLSIRMGGMTIRRAKISGAHFVFGVFDSDTGQSDGTVLVEDVVGSNAADTCIWCDAQDDFKTTFDLKLTFRRVHLSGSPAFLKATRVIHGTFRFESCTLNGQPVTASMVPPGSVIA